MINRQSGSPALRKASNRWSKSLWSDTRSRRAGRFQSLKRRPGATVVLGRLTGTDVDLKRNWKLGLHTRPLMGITGDYGFPEQVTNDQRICKKSSRPNWWSMGARDAGGR